MADEDEVPSTALTPAMFALLLALRIGDRHGYALMADVARLTSDTIRLGPGTLYRTLQRLRVDGLIEETETEDVPRADRRAESRRSYRITARGHQAAAAEASRLALLVDTARAVGLLPDGRG
jgi:DNA-binding PadR family transcriptional regulator